MSQSWTALINQRAEAYENPTDLEILPARWEAAELAWRIFRDGVRQSGGHSLERVDRRRVKEWGPWSYARKSGLRMAAESAPSMVVNTSGTPSAGTPVVGGHSYQSVWRGA